MDPNAQAVEYQKLDSKGGSIGVENSSECAAKVEVTEPPVMEVIDTTKVTVERAEEMVEEAIESDTDSESESEDLHNAAFLSIAEIEHHEHERNTDLGPSSSAKKQAGNLFTEVLDNLDTKVLEPIIEGFLNEFSIPSDIVKNWIIALLEMVKPKRGTWSEAILQIVRKLVRGKLEDPDAKWDDKALPESPYALVPMARKYHASSKAADRKGRISIGWSAKMNNKELPSVLNEMPSFFVLSKPPNWTCPGRDSGVKELRGMYEKTSTQYQWFEEKLPSTTELQTSGNPESLILWAMNELRYPALYDLGVTQFGLCHRLDCQTSGPIIVAKTKDAWRRIVRQFCCASQFQERKLAKMYLVLVHGSFEEKQGMIKKGIKVKKEKKTHISVVANDGQPSFTLYWVLAELTQNECKECYSLCLVRILTGRSHQIRVHMQSIDHPVCCDPKYGTSSVFCPRLFLHSYFLAFQDPDTNKQQQVYCPLHTDLRDTLRTMSPHPITTSLIETGLITGEAMSAAKALIRPSLPRNVYLNLSDLLKEHAQEKPLSLLQLRKLYANLTDYDLDTELCGFQHLASLLKENFSNERLCITEVPRDGKSMQVVEKEEESSDIPLEEKSWLFGKRKDHAEDEHVIVSYTSEEKSKEPMRLLSERREQLMTALVAHEVKAYLGEHDELGEGVSGHVLLDHLSNTCNELVSFLAEWNPSGVLHFVRQTDGVEEVDPKDRKIAEDTLFRCGPSTVTAEQVRILDNLKDDLRRAFSYTCPSDWRKIIVPRPFPPIHGKCGASLEEVLSTCLGDSPPDTMSDLRERVRTAFDSFEMLFANLKKQPPRLEMPDSKRAKTVLKVRRPAALKGPWLAPRRSHERDPLRPRNGHSSEGATLVPRRNVTGRSSIRGSNVRGVRLSSVARDRPRYARDMKISRDAEITRDIARPKLRANNHPTLRPTAARQTHVLKKRKPDR